MLSSLGIILFMIVMLGVAWVLNYVVVFYGSKRGWFDEPLVKKHWYDKYLDRIHEIYIEDLERKRDGKPPQA